MSCPLTAFLSIISRSHHPNEQHPLLPIIHTHNLPASPSLSPHSPHKPSLNKCLCTAHEFVADQPREFSDTTAPYYNRLESVPAARNASPLRTTQREGWRFERYRRARESFFRQWESWWWEKMMVGSWWWMVSWWRKGTMLYEFPLTAAWVPLCAQDSGIFFIFFNEHSYFKKIYGRNQNLHL